MKLTDLIKSVQERSLSKDQLEGYFDNLSELEAQMHLEMAELEKSEALFIDSCVEETDAARKRKWSVQKEGQRQIEIKNYIRAVKPLLSSVKNRIYQKIY